MKKDKIFIKKLIDSKKNIRRISITGLYSLFEAKQKPEFYFEGECHSPWEMVYIIEGLAGITAGDKIFTLSAGDVILHKPMEFHKIWSADGTSPRFLVCSFDLEGSLSQRLGGVYHLEADAKVIMNSLLNNLITEFQQPNASTVNYFRFLDKNETTLQIILNQLELLLLYLSRYDNQEPKISPTEKMRLYTEIVEILENHIYNKITITEIAQKCNVSTATVKNCFAEYAGCGVHKYFLNIKIRAAMEMLKNGSTVNEVSDILQFSNPNYFSYVFKRETGICASTYKK